MTIAAGFVYNEGVLLCADSEISTYTGKIDGRKVGFYVGPWGSSCIALAGNADFAATAAQRVMSELNKSPRVSEDVMATVERVLDKYYRKLVLSNPRHSTLPLDYSLLLAFYLPGEGTKLYVTQDTALKEVTSYRCEGIGESLGHYLIRTLWKPQMDENEALSLASYVIASTKQNVKGCGGHSVFLCLRSDGTVRDHSQTNLVKHIENIYGWYEQEARKFMLSHACATDEEFRDQLATLRKRSIHIRKMWKGLTKPPKPPREAKRSARKSTRHEK